MNKLKRTSTASPPAAKKIHSFFSSNSGGHSGPSRLGTFTEGDPKDLVHFHHLDPLESSSPPAHPVSVVFYDLDGTLIKTREGGRFPKSREDWTWWHASVPGKLLEEVEEGKHVIVLSNQADKRPKIRSEWRAKLPLIAAKIPSVPFRVLAALEKDVYRKPNTGMLDFLIKLYRSKGWEIDIAKSIYVGDAAGRSKDHGDTDYTMALNSGLRFLTPEEHFLNKGVAYPIPPKSFRPSISQKTTSLPRVVPSDKPITRKEREIVIFVGLPASGKTSFFRRHFASQYAHVNQDTLKTREACVKAVRTLIEEGKSVVVDNTNRNKSTRAVYIALANELHVPIRVFHFSCTLELAKHNNMYRAFYGPADEPKREALPLVAFSTFTSGFEAPTEQEGFDEVRTVNFVWDGTDKEYALWDRYMLDKR